MKTHYFDERGVYAPLARYYEQWSVVNGDTARLAASLHDKLTLYLGPPSVWGSVDMSLRASGELGEVTATPIGLTLATTGLRRNLARSGARHANAAYVASDWLLTYSSPAMLDDPEHTPYGLKLHMSDTGTAVTDARFSTEPFPEAFAEPAERIESTLPLIRATLEQGPQAA